MKAGTKDKINVVITAKCNEAYNPAREHRMRNTSTTSRALHADKSNVRERRRFIRPTLKATTNTELVGLGCLRQPTSSSTITCWNWFSRPNIDHLPQYLDQMIKDYATTRQLRSSYKNLLAVPYVKMDTAARAFRVSAPTIWNSLPTLVKSSSTLVTFRRHLKTFLYRRAFDWPLTLRASEWSYWQITARYKFIDWLIDCNALTGR